MYTKYFKALVVKKVAKRTSDSRASTPSIMGIDEYRMPEPGNQGQQPHANSASLTGEGAMVPPANQPLGNVTFADPVVDDAVVHIHAPQLEGESDKSFERCRNAAQHFSQPLAQEVGVKTEHHTNDMDSFTTHSQDR